MKIGQALSQHKSLSHSAFIWPSLLEHTRQLTQAFVQTNICTQCVSVVQGAMLEERVEKGHIILTKAGSVIQGVGVGGE